jgi:thioredoxin reductase (NADPH)
MNDAYDIAVVGAGPAGMTAALYGKRAGMNVVLFEGRMAGGQMSEAGIIENYPGFPDGIAGIDLAMAMREQVEHQGITIVDQLVDHISPSADHTDLVTGDTTYHAHALICAMGAHHRQLNVPGEAELIGHGVSYCATCDGNFFRGRSVAVVGGGDAAVGAALYLSRICTQVALIHRRDTFRASQRAIDRLSHAPNVQLLCNEEVLRLEETPQHKLAHVVIRSTVTGKETVLNVDGLFVMAGHIPSSDLIAPFVQCDDHGYISTDEQGATSHVGIWAAGDIRSKHLRQVTTATADGANAAEAAAEWCAS